MAQEYKIVHLDAGKEPFIDRNGNQWINVLFEGFSSEPTKWVMRPESTAKYRVGDMVYGRLESVEGKNYQRFYKEQKPETGGATQLGSPTRPAYQPNDNTQESIARSVALKASVDVHEKGASDSAVLATADTYLSWLQGRLVSTQQSPLSGLEKARQVAQSLKRDDRDEDADIRSMLESSQPYPEEDLPAGY